MALNYVELFSAQLLETLVQETLSSPFITSNVQFMNAKDFHFTSLTTSGFKSHNSANLGWNTGTFDQQDHVYTLTFDRDIQFSIDVNLVDITNKTASIQNIATTFQETQVAPETDAYFFSKVATIAKGITGLHTETTTSTYTVSNVLSKLKSFIKAGRLRRYNQNGGLLMYVNSTIMDLLEQSDKFVRNIELTQIADGGLGIETRVTSLDGVSIIEVIDDERFYDKFDFTDGFKPVSHTTEIVGSKKINVLLASLEKVKLVPKLNNIYFFEPGGHTLGDAYLYQHRQLSDVFVFPNGARGIDSVYVDTDTTEYVGV